jgi:tol-pal system protein YbgF
MSPFRPFRSTAFAVAAVFVSAASAQPARAQMSASELIVRLDRLEGQVRQLTGTVEQLQFRNQQLEQQLKRSQEDNEFRFGEMGGGRGGAGAASAGRPRSQPGQPPAAMPPPQGQSVPPPNLPPPGRRSDIEEPPYDPPRSSAQSMRRSDAFDPDEEPDAPGVPRPLGGMAGGRGGPPPGSIIQEEIPPSGQRGRGSRPMDLGSLSDRVARDPQFEPPGQLPPGPSGPSPQIAAAPGAEPRTIQGALPPPPARNPNATGAGPAPQIAAAPSGGAATSRDEFDAAYGNIQRKDFGSAEAGMREFLRKYPSDRLVSEAKYWLGESLYQRQRYRDAAEAFLTVSTKFENSGKAPDALLRLGQSLAALKEREAACATLGEVMRKYPRASANVKQGVEREQKRAGC